MDTQDKTDTQDRIQLKLELISMLLKTYHIQKKVKEVVDDAKTLYEWIITES